MTTQPEKNPMTTTYDDQNRYNELPEEWRTAVDRAINSAASGSRVEITLRNPYTDDVDQSYVFDRIGDRIRAAARRAAPSTFTSYEPRHEVDP